MKDITVNTKAGGTSSTDVPWQTSSQYQQQTEKYKSSSSAVLAVKLYIKSLALWGW